jgi:hypothetical protein
VSAQEALTIIDSILRQLDEVVESSRSIDEAYERLERWKRRAVAELRLVSPAESRALEEKRNAFAITDSFEPFEKEVAILRAFLNGYRDEITSSEVKPTSYNDERDIAQLCIAGHWANSRVRDMPEFNKAFCDECGSKTIAACPKCKGPIPGGVPGITSFSDKPDPAPKFCVHCGSPYPWTQLALQTALDISDEVTGLSFQQREELKSSIRDLVQESPKTQLAVIRFKKLIGSAGSAIGDALKKTLTDIVSEVIKRQIWG